MHLRRRIQEYPDLEIWQIGLRKIAASSFCRGDNERGWVAHFGWLCERSEAIVKAAEGVYDDRTLRLTAAGADEYRRWRRELALGGRDGCAHDDPACETQEDHEERLKRDWMKRRQAGRT